VKAITLLTLVTVSTTALAQSGSMMQDSLYSRMGGIHKIAAAIDNCVEMEASDSMLMANANFKKLLGTGSHSFAKFGATSYIANLTGGPQMAYTNLAAIQKGLGLTKKQNERAWSVRWMAFEKAGVAKKDFIELRKMLEMKMKREEPMMMMAEMFDSKTSLYARLGGIEPISMVVNDFIDMLATDSTVGANPHVVRSLTSGRVSAAGLKYLVTEQLGMASGGPFKYSGKTMLASHTGLMISEKEWGVAASLLKKVMDKYQVPAKEQGEVFGAVGATHDDIVNK
jgi:hemoglobin